MSKLQFKYLRIQGKELARNTMYAKGAAAIRSLRTYLLSHIIKRRTANVIY